MKWSLWTRTVATIAVTMCAFTPVAVANAAALCARPRTDGTFNASVRIREMCRANERQLDPSALGLQGPLGPQGSVGPSGPQGAIGTQGPAGPGLAVKDVNGTVVGQVLQEVNTGSGRAIEVYREVAGGKFRFSVRRDGFMPADPGIAINFDGANCTGSAFLQVESVTVDTGVLIDQAYVHNDLLYYRSGLSTVFNQLSQMFFPVDSVAACSGGVSQFFIPPAACCRTFVSTSSLNGYPVSTFELNTLGLVPPFHVEAP